MSEDSRIRDLWWGPSGQEVLFKSGTRYFRVGDGGHAGYLRLPDDAVRLVVAPSAPRVFFPGDTVPAESAVMDGDGRVFWSPNDATYGYPVLDIELPYLEEWQAAVDRARADREAK